jgi:hypothetical protein
MDDELDDDDEWLDVAAPSVLCALDGAIGAGDDEAGVATAAALERAPAAGAWAEEDDEDVSLSGEEPGVGGGGAAADHGGGGDGSVVVDVDVPAAAAAGGARASAAARAAAAAASRRRAVELSRANFLAHTARLLLASRTASCPALGAALRAIIPRERMDVTRSAAAGARPTAAAVTDLLNYVSWKFPLRWDARALRAGARAPRLGGGGGGGGCAHDSLCARAVLRAVRARATQAPRGPYQLAVVFVAAARAAGARARLVVAFDRPGKAGGA